MKFNKKTFEKLSAVVLNSLGKQEFAKDESGRSVLTSEDKDALKGSFTPEFLEKFEKGLEVEATLAEQETVMQQLKDDNAAKLVDFQQKVEAAQKAADEAKAAVAAKDQQISNLQQTVAILSDQSDDTAEETLRVAQPKAEAGKDAWLGVKPNHKHFHTSMVEEYLAGNTGKAMASSTGTFTRGSEPGATGNTIDVDEVATEFGTYLSNQSSKLEILKKLVPRTESQQYMTTKMAITEWRASSAIISSVVQQYVSEWTPLGGSKFTPIVIKNRRHKVNLPIKPDDINDSWLSYLYEEGMTVDQMPVTRYIIEQLLRPKIDSDIEMLMIATGEYEELGEVTSGQAGQSTSKAMDGYVTLLKKAKAAGDSNMNFFVPSTAIDADTIVDVIEEYAEWLGNTAPLYAKKGMNIFIDPQLKLAFDKKYRELYPTTKNEDGARTKPDFSNLTFVELEAMRGTGVFFSTPKENFIRLIHKNAAGAETKLWMQVTDYTVKVFAEFWLGCGYAMEELVFAYVPDEAASGSGA